MKALETLHVLAQQARKETAPETNIATAPLLSACRGERSLRLGPMVWSAGLSAVAAGVILMFALHQQQSSAVDPISSLFSAAQVQLP